MSRQEEQNRLRKLLRTHYWCDGERGYAVYLAELSELLEAGVVDDGMLAGPDGQLRTDGFDEFGHPFRIRYMGRGYWRVIRIFHENLLRDVVAGTRPGPGMRPLFRFPSTRA